MHQCAMEKSLKPPQECHILLSEWERLPRNGSRLLGLSRKPLYALIRSGKIEARKVGKTRLVHVPSLIQFIKDSPK